MSLDGKSPSSAHGMEGESRQSPLLGDPRRNIEEALLTFEGRIALDLAQFL